MQQTVKTLSEFIKEIKDFQKTVKKDGKKIIANAFKSLFVQFPSLEEVSFNLSTPTWNDGDVCSCSMSDFSYKFNNLTKEQKEFCNEEVEYFEENEIFQPDEICYLGDDGEKILAPQITIMKSKECEKLQNTLVDITDILQSIFGDPVIVLVNRKGIKISDYYSNE